MRLVVLGLALLALASCADTGDTFPLNAQAKDLGPIKFAFVRTGIGEGPVTITMASGEVLKGTYRVAFGSAMVVGSAAGQPANFTAFGDGQVQFVATGPKTQMLCRGYSTPMGHGNGRCQTYDGAVWAISW
jgi:hypothetical protein